MMASGKVMTYAETDVVYDDETSLACVCVCVNSEYRHCMRQT